MENVHKKKMAIIAGYFPGETYGLLGPQIAATIIQDNTEYECIVIAVTREDTNQLLKKTIASYFGDQRQVIGFSTLCGREDLFTLARDLKNEGAVTILAGPQADVDFQGEIEWQDFSHRFRGVSNCFTCCLHGPAEQIIPVLAGLGTHHWQSNPGVIYRDACGRIIRNAERSWDEKYLQRVRWNNLYRAGESGLTPHTIQTAQVLQQIGCPYAGKMRRVDIGYPALFKDRKAEKIGVSVKGCSFCDVAVDKGFYGALSMATVLSQIQSLPQTPEERKIPFELINENPLTTLPLLLNELEAQNIRLSRINLTMWADWFLRGEEHIRHALQRARKGGFSIAASSIGFESFDDMILNNLNKGVGVQENLGAVALMRRLKDEFPKEWIYSTNEGSIHGFIYPTPWDTEESTASMRGVMGHYFLPQDILPPKSIPLIIHHASWLGDWMREIERREGVCFRRNFSIIEWWD